MRLLRGVALAAVLVASLAACGSAAAQADLSTAQVVVELRDYSVNPSVPSIPAGNVKIGIRNKGAMAHDLVVVKTETPFDKLAIDNATAQAKEDGLVGKTDPIAVGGSKALTLDLAPGSYVLMCNIPGHYQLGMRVAFKVT